MDKPVTWITGSRKGIGRELARHYAGLGHQVVGCSREACDWRMEGYEHHCLDVADERALGRLAAHILRTYGRLDHLINGAGTAAMNHALLTPASTVQRLMETNLLGTFLAAREAAKLMQRRSFGRIVNFTTVAVPLKLEGEAAYAATKSAVESLTAILARELAPLSVTVNAIGPAPTETDLVRNVPAEKIEALVGRQAIKRLGRFSDVTNVVDFFLSRQSDFVTGQVIYLGGV